MAGPTLVVASAAAAGDPYDVDLGMLRALMGRNARWHDQGPRKKRKLVRRAMDIDEVEGSLHPQLKQCIPQIRATEKELNSKRMAVTRLLLCTRALEEELMMLKDTQRRSLALTEAGLELATVADGLPMDQNDVMTYSRLLGVTRKDVRKLHKLVTEAMADEPRSRQAVKAMLQRHGEEAGIGFDGGRNVQQLSLPEAGGAVVTMMGANENVRWEGSRGSEADAVLGMFLSRVVTNKLDRPEMSYDKIVSMLVRGLAMHRMATGLGSTSEGYRERETRRSPVSLPPVSSPSRQRNVSALSRSPVRCRSRATSPTPIPSVETASNAMHNASSLMTRETSSVVMMELRRELETASSRLVESKGKLHQDVMLTAYNFRGPQSNLRTRILTIQMGLEKLGSVVQARREKAVCRAMRLWGAQTQYKRNLAIARRFLQLLSAQRLVEVVVRLRDRRLQRGVTALGRHMVEHREAERRSCALEAQRIVRGFIGRQRWKIEQKRVAATRIQCWVRGTLSRHRIRYEQRRRYEIREQLKRRQIITRRAATTLQRVVRGFIARRRLKRMLETIKREKAALQIQCLARGVLARNRRKIVKKDVVTRHAAVRVQKIGRGYLDRKRVQKLKQERQERLEAEAKEQEERMKRMAARYGSPDKIKSLRRTDGISQTSRSAFKSSPSDWSAGSPDAGDAKKNLSGTKHKKKKKKRKELKEEEEGANVLVIPTSTDGLDALIIDDFDEMFGETQESSSSPTVRSPSPWTPDGRPSPLQTSLSQSHGSPSGASTPAFSKLRQGYDSPQALLILASSAPSRLRHSMPPTPLLGATPKKQESVKRLSLPSTPAPPSPRLASTTMGTSTRKLFAQVDQATPKTPSTSSHKHTSVPSTPAAKTPQGKQHSSLPVTPVTTRTTRSHKSPSPRTGDSPTPKTHDDLMSLTHQLSPAMMMIVQSLGKTMSFVELVLLVVRIQALIRGFIQRRRTQRDMEDALSSHVSARGREAYFSTKVDYQTLRGRYAKVVDKAKRREDHRRATRGTSAQQLSLKGDDPARAFLRHQATVERMMHDMAEKVAATTIQAIVRAFLGVRRFRRIKAEKRQRERMLQVQTDSALTIQRFWRGHRVRARMWNDLLYIKRRLTEEGMSERERAALRIQCAYRMHQAHREYKRLYKQYKLHRAKLEEEEYLQREVDRQHHALEIDMKVLTIQCAVRIFLARRRQIRRKMDRENKDSLQSEEKRWFASALLQRVFRGYKSRKWFRRNYNRLSDEREERKYCIECTGKQRSAATRLCKVCLDRYCESCWKRFHAHGNKRTHTYKTLDGDAAYIIYRQQGTSDWVEHWDSSVQATYFYNVRTGEASWTMPEELENQNTTVPFAGYDYPGFKSFF